MCDIGFAPPFKVNLLPLYLTQHISSIKLSSLLIPLVPLILLSLISLVLCLSAVLISNKFSVLP